MSGEAKPKRPLSDVAIWHKLSGLPDNVTDEGLTVSADDRQRQQVEKNQLRAEIAYLSTARQPDAVRGRARLAASYLIAGDVETARRYVNAAHELAAEP